MHPFRYNRKDWLVAIIITVLLLGIGGVTLTKGLPYWGDDSSAYISEGIAIAEGNLMEQARLNYIMHPSELSAESDPDGLVYVWGYPLMLSVVYKTVGFDRAEYSSIIWYKIPLLLGWSLLGGVAYLFFRRRFSAGVSAVLASTLCLSRHLVENLNLLYSDLPFLFFSMLSLLLMELFVEKAVWFALARHKKKDMESSQIDAKHRLAGVIPLAAIYGTVLWFTHEIRLNGKTVCMVAAVGHAIYLIKNRKQIERKSLWLHFLPYIAMGCLIFISEQMIFAPATSNMSDVGRATVAEVQKNIKFYWKQIYNYLNGLPRIDLKLTGHILAVACVAGIIIKGIKENTHLTLLLIGTLIVDIMLPYEQGLRYLYNILPLILMFAAYGLQATWQWFCKAVAAQTIFRRFVKACCAVLILFLPVFYTVSLGIENRDRIEDSDVYSAEAVDMYQYIQANVPEDKVIAFGKPRALFLNTERVSIRTGYNGHTISDADYYLFYDTNYGEFSKEKEEAAVTPKTEIYHNRLYTLYEVDKDRN